MEIDMTTIFEALVGLVVAILSTVVIPYIKQRLGAERYEYYKKLAKVAVQAMEMLFREAGAGEEKKAAAIEYLRSLGVNLPEAELSVLIESAVCELKEEL